MMDALVAIINRKIVRFMYNEGFGDAPDINDANEISEDDSHTICYHTNKTYYRRVFGESKEFDKRWDNVDKIVKGKIK